MYWMNELGPSLDYKIVPEDSLSIIGSSSKNTAGELYTTDIRFRLAEPTNRRNKRLLEIVLALWLLLSLPIQLLFIKKSKGLLENSLQVLLGKKSWVGYVQVKNQLEKLPTLPEGVLTPLSILSIENLSDRTIQRINLLYAKDYQLQKDLDIIWKAYRHLGMKNK